jgi:CubicO group peptidase (beta-lactamase class C family)
MRRALAVIIPVVLVLSLALAVAGFGAEAAPAGARLDAIAETALREWRFPGIAIAVVQDDRVSYLAAHGVKRVGGDDPVSPDTLFEIGSTTKAFTTTALALLADEKKLDWDDPVRKHVPWFHLDDACGDALVTLRDIVSHRTGLGRRDELWDAARYSRTEFLRRIGSLPLSRPFRSSYQYSNMLYVLAGEVVASVSGMPWEAFVRSRLFEPLGMQRSAISLAEWNAADHAIGHYLDRAQDRIAVQVFNDYENIAPAGAIKSSARDMAQWLRFQLAGGALDGKSLLSSEALAETRRPHFPLQPDPELTETNLQSYALGWIVSDYRGTLLVSHGGALNGFRAQVALLPRLRAGVVVLANAGLGRGVTAARNAILDELLGLPPARDWNAWYRAAEAKDLEKRAAARAEQESKRPRDIRPCREPAAYAGRYEQAGYGEVQIELVEGGGLLLRWRRVGIPLRHFAFDTFLARDDAEDIDELVRFRLDEYGAVRAFQMFDLEFARK